MKTFTSVQYKEIPRWMKVNGRHSTSGSLLFWVLFTLGIITAMEYTAPLAAPASSSSLESPACTEMILESTEALNCARGSSSNDLFDVRDNSTKRLNNRTARRRMSSGTANDLEDVWGSASNDLFAVGEFGTILHYDGTAWTPMSSGTPANLFSVWGNGKGDLFAVGSGGTVLSYTGSGWATTASSELDLNGIGGNGPGDAFAVGNSGRVLHLSVSPPAPDIKANGSDAALFISSGETLSITASLDAEGSSGPEADWWIVVDSPFGLFYFHSSGNWLPGIEPTYRKALASLNSFEVLNSSGLPAGTYTFYFAYDLKMDGDITVSQLQLDGVVVNISDN